DFNDIRTSQSLHHSNASGVAGTAYTASACVPLQWISDGLYEIPPINHGGTQDRVLLWWRHKLFNRVDPHYGGREYVHRATSWSFHPRMWDQEDFGGTVQPAGGGTAKFMVGMDCPIFTWDIFD